ncbi:heterodisulfide reductase-related iron-sulfur binding cluster [Chakrabartyella piscis]|uniref:heterodisulfide reductase-related iron-sulfur binding cluster n=1 Tax=Chakrabartyella piscis TaxID=2918914 RepID=UPI002958639D|nr:heterodisulfide reductase-related iron-sulfur binding cluster [Chakrabartyella piscis]
MESELLLHLGCSFQVYKPELRDKLLEELQKIEPHLKLYTKCCKQMPNLSEGTLVYNDCTGCHRRFSLEYAGLSSRTIWEVIDGIEGFPLPTYEGMVVSVHDSCGFRGQPSVHKAVRSLLAKMKIAVVESAFHSEKSICCGHQFYGKLPEEKVFALQKKRAEQFPCEMVVTTCVSCVKSLQSGGRVPKHLLDLIFEEETNPYPVEYAVCEAKKQDFRESQKEV